MSLLVGGGGVIELRAECARSAGVGGGGGRASRACRAQPSIQGTIGVIELWAE
jgi:hypothetical protein